MRILPSDIDAQDFYQSKFDFYRRFAFWTTVFTAVGMPTYFVSDCQLFGRFAWETLPARFFCLIPLIIYIILNRRYSSHKIFFHASYFILHCALWCTLWAVYFLPDKTHFSEGSIVMQLTFFAVGFAFPWLYACAAHTLMIITIIVVNQFMPLPNFDIILSLNIPCWLAICLAHYVMQRLYVKHYQTTKRLEYISLYDPLTGAHNRHITKTLLKDNSDQFKDSLKQPLTAAMFDIDFFKRVNDQYGHANGDAVLKEFASIVLASKTTKDKFIRWGGEEFLLLMPETDLDTAKEFIDSIRIKVQKNAQSVCPITVSAGIAKYNGKNYKKLFNDVDEALYAAKKNGRNQVMVNQEN